MSKEIKDLNNTRNQLALIVIYRALHPTITQYTFFSSERGTYSRTDYMIGYKAILNKFKMTEIRQCYLL